MATVDLNGIKTAIQDILSDANTTTGSPIDLSNGLTNRVQRVLTVNPELIPIQPSYFPCITMFYESKTVDLSTIAKDQLTGKRRSVIECKVVGIVWKDDMNTADFDLADLADNEVEILMENIEQVLRSDPKLDGKALWSYPTGVTFHNLQIDESSHFRTGIMNFQITVHY